MRLVPVLTAIVVCLSLYALVFERPALMGLAGGEAAAEDGAPEGEAGDGAPGIRVVALRSSAQEVGGAVVLRGRTEAARQVDVLSETSGKVTSEPLRKGASVEAGELLCELDPGTRETVLAEAEARLPEAQARLGEAEARLAEAEINDRAAARLSRDGFASETRVAATAATVQAARAGVESARASLQGAEAAVAAARKEIERLRITAPFGGLLESDTAELGSLLQPGALCATVIRLDPIKLVGFVPETEVDRVEVGARAGARLASGRRVAGEVIFLSRSADETTRTFRTEIKVPNDDLSIRDGQTVEIMIEADGQSAHLLPQSSLTLDDDGRLGVRIVGEADRAAFAPIQVVRDTTEGVWVSGLPDDAEVIVVGQEFVIDGVPLSVSYREPRG